MLSTEIFFFHFSVKLSRLQLKPLVALYSCDHPQLTAERPGRMGNGSLVLILT